MATIGTLSDEAVKRKERLKAMRQKQLDYENETDDNEGQEQTEKEKLPRPMFRSYKPETESLKDQLKSKAKPAEVKEAITDQLDAGKTDHMITEVGLSNLAPRKPDWDLKRDVSKKLEKLERRTQRAIAELIRERLKESQGQEDLVSAVNAGEALGKAEAQADVD